MSNEEMFKEFEFNEEPETIITSINGLDLPEEYLAFMKEHEDTYYTISKSFEEFLNNMDEELA